MGRLTSLKPRLTTLAPRIAQVNANRQQTRSLHTGSKQWQVLRHRILTRDLYTCRHCKRYGNHVDHIDEDSTNNTETNLQTLCHSCHSVKTNEAMQAKA